MDQLITLCVQLGKALKKRGYKLALAESCTGGLVSSTMTEIPGSSAWFDCAFVTYSNASKNQLLNVPQDTLKKFGAVSESTAKAMVSGALQHSQADIAGSITGIAGPDGGSKEKPVGTVCFGWTRKPGKLFSKTVLFSGTRQQVRVQAANFLMTTLLELVEADNG